MNKNKEMVGAALCEKGLEDVSAQEIKELIGVNSVVHGDVLLFPLKHVDELARLSYMSQSLRRVMMIACEGNFGNSFEHIPEKMKNVDFGLWLDGNKSFKVVCERDGTHDFTSSSAAEAMGELIIKLLIEKNGSAPKVDFDAPDVQFFLRVVDSYFAFGVDYGGFDLSKREYRVFTHPAALKGTVAYGIVRLAKFDPKKNILCYFSKSGVVEIEAALFASEKSVRYYQKNKFAFLKLAEFAGKDPDVYFGDFDKQIKEDKLRIVGAHADLRHVTAGKKNAKIAGVDKLVDFPRMDIDWLDVKFDEGAFDIVVAYVVSGEAKQLPDFLEQCPRLLTGDGILVVISLGKSCADIAKKKGFELLDERILHRGENVLLIERFRRK